MKKRWALINEKGQIETLNIPLQKGMCRIFPLFWTRKDARIAAASHPDGQRFTVREISVIATVPQ